MVRYTSNYFFICPECGKVRQEETPHKVKRRLTPLCYTCSQRAKRGINKGSKNNMWKGDKVKYRGLHAWLNRNLSKPVDGLCEICRQKPIRQIANVTGVYNRDFDNWRYMCVSCNKHFQTNKPDKVKDDWIKQHKRGG